MFRVVESECSCRIFCRDNCNVDNIRELKKNLLSEQVEIYILFHVVDSEYSCGIFCRDNCIVDNLVHHSIEEIYFQSRAVASQSKKAAKIARSRRKKRKRKRCQMTAR